MKVVKFDQAVFDALISCGFRYCYSKSVAGLRPGQINIFLTPIGSGSDIYNLQPRFDSYYKLTQESEKKMSMIIDVGSAVFINLNDTLLKDCYEQEDTDH